MSHKPNHACHSYHVCLCESDCSPLWQQGAPLICDVAPTSISDWPLQARLSPVFTICFKSKGKWSSKVQVNTTCWGVTVETSASNGTKVTNEWTSRVCRCCCLDVKREARLLYEGAQRRKRIVETNTYSLSAFVFSIVLCCDLDHLLTTDCFLEVKTAAFVQESVNKAWFSAASKPHETSCSCCTKLYRKGCRGQLNSWQQRWVVV